jgi:chaperonin GroEL
MKNNKLTNKLISFDPNEKLLQGISTLAKAVGSTLGPLGNNVALGQENDLPRIVHDGVSVAKSIKVGDPFEDIGVQLVKEAAMKTEDVTGDGTTTATILTHYLVKEGNKLLAKGIGGMKLRKGMLLALNDLVKQIKEKSIEVKDLEQVATISAQDEEIGKLIAEAFTKVGKDGVVEVEESKGRDLVLDFQEGMQIDSGYASPFFINNTSEEAELEDVYVLIIDAPLSTLAPMESFFKSFLEKSKTMLIIADEINGEALASLVVNKLRGALNIVAVETPSYGDNATGILEDISALTGAVIISHSTGKSIEDIKVEDLGFLKKVISSKETTKLIGGNDEDAVRIQAEKIRTRLSKSNLGLIETQLLKERLAKLTTGVAILNVGARTSIEMKEKKERAIDAVKATRAALEEGILPGGAIIYPHLAKNLILPLDEDDEIQSGYGLVCESVREPFRVLMHNSGIGITDIPEEYGIGIDVIDGQQKDMIKAGIIDPAKVVRSALENAVSIASSILTTRTVVVTDPSELEKE